MPELKYTPVAHDKAAFLKKAMKRPGFKEAFDDLALEFQLVNQMLNARRKAG